MPKAKSSLSKRNQRGLWFMLIVMVCVILAPRVFYKYFRNDPWNVSETLLDTSMEKVERKIAYNEYDRSQKFKKNSKYKKPPKAFDPNLYTFEEWKKLGLSDKQVNVVLKFTSRGIYSNDELQQIFVIPEVLYDLIKDSTFYPIKQFNKNQFSESKKKEYVVKIDIIELNSATIEELESLPGIGNYLAKKIIEQRSKLGGFATKNQLLEVYRIDQEKFNGFERNIVVDQMLISKININTATAAELQSHPYISWNVANSIVKMRPKFQKYSNFEQLLESVLIDRDLLLKIQPYLTL
jgi:competence protein ComEA